MTNLFVRLTNWLHDERGDFNIGGGGVIWFVVGILAIIALLVWLWINIDVNEDPGAILGL